jgi:hypothetical protein
MTAKRRPLVEVTAGPFRGDKRARSVGAFNGKRPAGFGSDSEYLTLSITSPLYPEQPT